MTGYGPREPADLKAMCEKHDAAAVDIRIRPYSKRPEWRIDNLRNILPGYVHLPELGNAARFGDGGIEIADMDGGAAKLRAIEGNTLLFCACWHADTCHRRDVAEELLRRHRIPSREIEWPKYQRPQGHYWNRHLGVEEKDTLAAMEDWCEKRFHSGAGVPVEKFDKLLATRRAYGMAEVALRLFLDGGPLPDDYVGLFAEQVGMPEKRIREVIRRLVANGMIAKDAIEFCDDKWTIYRLKGERHERSDSGVGSLGSDDNPAGDGRDAGGPAERSDADRHRDDIPAVLEL